MDRLQRNLPRPRPAKHIQSAWRAQRSRESRLEGWRRSGDHQPQDEKSGRANKDPYEAPHEISRFLRPRAHTPQRD